MNRYDIGRRIEAYRGKRKMSTMELAERVKRSQATISRIENGKQGLTFELLSSIAAALCVHPFSLLSDEPPRPSVFLPEGMPGEGRRGCPPSLLANAIHGGRVRRRLRIEAAAEILGVGQAELEAVELALSVPDDALLGRICRLYGLPDAEMRALGRFGDAAPGTAGDLAYLQQLCSRIRHLVKNGAGGGGQRILGEIAELLDAADSARPLLPDPFSDDVGLFLNRLSLHLVNALKDNEFRGRMFRMAGLSPGGGQ